MRSIFHPAERARLFGRLNSLTAHTPSRWGQMSAPQMVCHLIDAVESSNGPSPHELVNGPLTWMPIKQLIIYVLPWPRARLQSPPDLLQTTPTTWAADTTRLRQAIERCAERAEGDASWPASDVFGVLSRRDWGALLRTHINHHFRQFGV